MFTTAMNKKALSIFVLFCAVVTGAGAQTQEIKTKGKVDSLLTASYFKSKYDTNYVKRPAERWLLKLSDNGKGRLFEI